MYYIQNHLECIVSVNCSFCHVIRARNELIRSVEHLVQFYISEPRTLLVRATAIQVITTTTLTNHRVSFQMLPVVDPPLGVIIRCKNLALYIRDCVSLCLSDETLKAVGPFYLVSMPGEVKDPTSLHWKCVICRGLHIYYNF